MLRPFKTALAGGLILTDSRQNEVVVIIILTTAVSVMYGNITTLYSGLV